MGISLGLNLGADWFLQTLSAKETSSLPRHTRKGTCFQVQLGDISGDPPRPQHKWPWSTTRGRRPPSLFAPHRRHPKGKSNPEFPSPRHPAEPLDLPIRAFLASAGMCVKAASEEATRQTDSFIQEYFARKFEAPIAHIRIFRAEVNRAEKFWRPNGFLSQCFARKLYCR